MKLSYRRHRQLLAIERSLDSEKARLSTAIRYYDSKGRGLRRQAARAEKASLMFQRLGLREMWGGVIDVDFDKLLDVLGPEQEDLLGRIIEERRHVRWRLSKPPLSQEQEAQMAEWLQKSQQLQARFNARSKADTP